MICKLQWVNMRAGRLLRRRSISGSSFRLTSPIWWGRLRGVIWTVFRQLISHDFSLVRSKLDSGSGRGPLGLATSGRLDSVGRGAYALYSLET